VRKRKGVKKSRNFLVSILDTWQYFNQDIPQKIEKSIVQEKLKQERKIKLGPRMTNKEDVFSPKEIAILSELVTNPRKSYIDIAKQLGLSRQTVKKKIEMMKQHSKIQFFVGVNYQKLNLDLVFLKLLFNNLKDLNELYNDLQSCPRVFNISKNIAQNSLMTLFGIEKSYGGNHNNQMVCMIEKFQLDTRVKECTVVSIHPEMYPIYLVFSPKHLIFNDDSSALGTSCCATRCGSNCENYINSKCPGCPCLGEYEREIFKII